MSKQVQGLEKHFDFLIELGFYQEFQKWKDTKVTEWTWTRPIKNKMQYDGYIATLTFFNRHTHNIYIYIYIYIYMILMCNIQCFRTMQRIMWPIHAQVHGTLDRK